MERQGVPILRIMTLILALFGLFAQLFSGHIIPGIMLASIAAILAVFLKGWSPNKFSLRLFSIGTLLAVAVLGCAYDAYAYFSVPHTAGNNYGGLYWSFLLILFLGSYSAKECRELIKQKNP